MPENAPNQSLQRAVRILYAVAGTEDGRTIEQIATRVGLRPNTAGRYVRTLEQEKLLVRREAPLRFLLGSAVADLKHLDDTRHLLTVAGRVLVRVQAEFPQSNFSLVEAEGVETYTRLRVLAIRPGHLVVDRAQLHLPYMKASSMLFLAYTTLAERDRFFHEHPFRVQGAPIWGTEQKLHAFLSEVVRKGHAMPDFPDKRDFRLATPVFAPGGQLVAAVGAYIHKDESARSRRRLLTLATRASREISAQLGGRKL